MTQEVEKARGVTLLKDIGKEERGSDVVTRRCDRLLRPPAYRDLIFQGFQNNPRHLAR